MPTRKTKRAAVKPRRGELPAELQARKVRARIELAGLRAAEKMQRAALANYTAAGRGRQNKDWRASQGSADLMILPDAATLNARARETVRNSWIASSMIRAAKRNVSGTGIRVVPAAKGDDGATLLRGLNATMRKDFDRWAGNKLFCDIERRQNFYQKQRLCVAERYTVGQAFVVWSYETPLNEAGTGVDRRKPVGLRLQSFEAEQLDTTILSHVGPDGVTREVRNGVELDPVTNAPVAYWFYTKNPNDYLSRTRYESRRVEAWRVFHYFDQERVLQTQGVTQLAPVLQEIRDFNRFKDATLWRAIMEACIGMVVIKSPVGASAGFTSPLGVTRMTGDAGTSATGMSTIDMVPGMVPHLNEGEDVKPFTPSSPGNQYDPFTTVTLRGIGAGAGMSADTITRHADGNYSAARQNMLEDWREWEPEQDNLVSDIILPVYTLFVTMAVAEGRYDDVAEFDRDEFFADPARFTDATCVAPARPWIDPEKEANAFAKMIDYRLITRDEIVTGRGKVFGEEMHAIGREAEDADAQGITFPEDAEQQDLLADANQKNADAKSKEAAAKVALRPPTPAPYQQPPAAMRRMDSPNYRPSPLPEIACAKCRFYATQAGDGRLSRCMAYDFKADPASTCDAFETVPVAHLPGGRRLIQSPPLQSGEPSIDNARAGGFAPDAPR